MPFSKTSDSGFILGGHFLFKISPATKLKTAEGSDGLLDCEVTEQQWQYSI